MCKVWIPQKVMKRVDNVYVPAFNVSSAEEFGELIYAIPEHLDANRLGFDKNFYEISLSMESSVKSEDFILSVGDPAVVAMCAAIMFKETGVVRFLKWDRFLKKYFPYESRENKK